MSHRLIAGLVRHADYHQLNNTPSALQPFPLTQEGERQCINGSGLIKEEIKKNAWTLCEDVDVSPLLRAWQTANILTSQLEEQCRGNLKVHEFYALSERCVGSVANLSTQEIESILQKDPRYESPPKNWKSNSHYTLPFPGAESLMDAGERLANHILSQMKILAENVHSDTLKLFVGHGAAFRHGAHVLGALHFDDIAKLSMYHAEPVFLEYKYESNRWEHIGGRWKVRKNLFDYHD